RAGARARLATPEPAVSGLFLVQFNGRPEIGWTEQLAALSVGLVHYVPDDAYVVRLGAVRVAAVAALPFVRWVGEFQPQHKIHPLLTAAFATNLTGWLPVKVLAAPGASALELAVVQRRLRSGARRHAFSLGTTFQGFVKVAGLRALAESSTVLWIEPAPRMKLLDEVATKIVAGETDTPGTLAHVQALGYDGRGVTVAVADSGLDSGDLAEMHPDLAGRVEALFAYDNLPDASDEHSHGTHVAGIVAGNGAKGEKDDAGYLWGLGVAPGARIVGQRIFDAAGEYRPPPSYARLTQDAVRSGAYIGSNSWGDDTAGQYDLSAAEFDALVRDADPSVPGEQAYVLEFSSGNAGPGGQTVGSPAVGKNVIATGATQNNRYEFPLYGEGEEVMADFSSRGPAEDGRIKPDLVAPGTWIASLRSIFANDNNSWGPIGDHYMYQGGTSQAGPHASGAAAVVVQWYRETHGGATPSPALVKAMLINSADDMGTAVIPYTGDFLGGEPVDGGGILVGDTGPVPNMDEGWGRLNLVNLIDSERRFALVDQGGGLATSGVYEQKLAIGPDEPLKVTLVYTDVPGLPAAIPALVNDLDLEVVAPDGRLFRGNAFVEGESVPDTAAGDRLNNVEAVHLATPQAGEWTVRVRGQNVVQDVHQRATGAPEQDFALAISGQLPAPGEGVVSWDREAYQARATATIRLVDAQLSAQPTTTVTVSSTTEPAGMTVTLSRLGQGGSFLGTVDLVPDPPAAGDGRLSVRDGDELAVVYADADPPGARRSTAAVDGRPPLISEVRSAAQFGRVGINWVTSEPANGTVFFGLTNAVTNLVLAGGYRQQHRLALPPLAAGETYYFFVASADRAGNATTNLLDGRLYYRFVAPQPIQALLLYTAEALFADGTLGDAPYPGIENWTGPLDALGIDYEVWDTSVEGRAPTAAELRSYRVVLWRPEELQGPVPGTLPAIAAYVQSGGSLFVASFDLLSRLGETPNAGDFAKQVLHVAASVEDGGAAELTSVAGDPVGGGSALALDYTAFPGGLIVDLLGIVWSDGPDHLTPDTNAAPALLQDEHRVVALHSPKTGGDATAGRVVFYSFAFEATPVAEAAPNNRVTLLGNALRFLAPELVGGSAVAFNQPAYSVPANVVIETIDSRRAGQGQVTASIANGPIRQTVSLTETPRRGVFRGRLTLRAATQPAMPDSLPAGNGDTLRVTYVDGANAESSVEAAVDTVKPAISAVASDPSYNEAYVAWNTDKPADALVRFGESPGDDSFLSRSAYRAESATEHGVLLPGLLPDKTYYFQVLSRDAAGNVAVDGNSGRLYSVRTLRPLTAPWTDPLDVGQPGWVVYNSDLGGGAIFDDGEDTGGFAVNGWQFGKPENSHGIAAHSGTNVWATNLKGDFVDLAFTDLISPAVSLVGGNRATLHFWHYYDFSSSGGSEDDPFGDFVIEVAQLEISTNNGASWKPLFTVNDEFSLDWEEVTLDLSKYVGSVVRFRFNYQMFAFSAGPRVGWLLDDIGVTLNSVASTEVSVTNNLAQARFVLRGPDTLQIAGAGRLLRTNVPPGQYEAVWEPVPYYSTPASQTNVLSAGPPLVFAGVYTFADTNRNELSDAWEQEFFHTVAPNHPADLDSDGDGAS
ncbi:MAG: S8 family serine peptidase, partial [Limisphaerales bacterium]